jgi:hypothetical protein
MTVRPVGDQPLPAGSRPSGRSRHAGHHDTQGASDHRADDHDVTGRQQACPSTRIVSPARVCRS